MNTVNSLVHQNSIKLSDTELLNKVTKITELTGCSNDLAVTALYDCDNQIEAAINKIFETTLKNSDDWREVPKNRKKNVTVENNVENSVESCMKDEELRTSTERQKFSRGRGRGRGNGRTSGRNIESAKSNSREVSAEMNGISKSNGSRSSRGRRSFRNVGIRGRAKPRNHDNSFHEEDNKPFDNVFDSGKPVNEDKWQSNDNEWLFDSPNEQNAVDEDLSHKLNCALKQEDHELLPVKDSMEKTENCSLEIVAKSSTKDEIFGDYSRTKPPPPLSVDLSDPVKLLTSNGIVCGLPKSDFSFSFGLNFNELSDKTPLSSVATFGSFTTNHQTTTKSLGNDNSSSFIANFMSDSPTSVDLNNHTEFDTPNFNKPQSLGDNDNLTKSMNVYNSTATGISHEPLDLSDNSSKPQTTLMDNPNHKTINSYPQAQSSISASSCITPQHISSSNNKTNAQHKTNVVPDSVVLPNAVAAKATSTSSAHHQHHHHPILQPPPGMSQPNHLMQQYQNPYPSQQHFSLLNIPSTNTSVYGNTNLLVNSGDSSASPGLAPVVAASSSANSDSSVLQHGDLISNDNISKEYHSLQKSAQLTANSKNSSYVSSSKVVSNNTTSIVPTTGGDPTSNNSTDVVSAAAAAAANLMPNNFSQYMPINCYLSQMIMNNFPSFIPQHQQQQQQNVTTLNSQEIQAQNSISSNANSMSGPKQYFHLPHARGPYQLGSSVETAEHHYLDQQQQQQKYEQQEMLHHSQQHHHQVHKAQQQQQQQQSSASQHKYRPPNSNYSQNPGNYMSTQAKDNDDNTTVSITHTPDKSAQHQQASQSSQPTNNTQKLVSNSQQITHRQSNSAQSNLIQHQQQGNGNSQSSGNRHGSGSSNTNISGSNNDHHRRMNYHQQQQQQHYNQHSQHGFNSSLYNPYGSIPLNTPNAPPNPLVGHNPAATMQQLHPQIHLMSQQVHSFQPTYQFNEHHLMNSMTNNPGSRNGTGMPIGVVNNSNMCTSASSVAVSSSVGGGGGSSTSNNNSGGGGQSRSRSNQGQPTHNAGGVPQQNNNLWHHNN